MPQNRNPKSFEAEARYRAGEKIVDIAKDMGFPAGTLRRWKSTQKWDDQKKQSERSLLENEPNNANARFQYDDLTRATNIKNNTDFSSYEDPEEKTKTTNRGGAPLGNKNAIGNIGGKGGPPKNKKALKTGEYEKIIFSKSTLNPEELAITTFDNCEYERQHTLLKTLNVREYRIMRAIQQLREIGENGTVVESFTEESSETVFTSQNRNKKGELWEGNTTKQVIQSNAKVSQPIMKRIMELEEALTRVQSRIQKAIEVLHKMKVDEINTMLNAEKLRLYKQKLVGQYDLDELLSDDFADFELDN